MAIELTQAPTFQAGENLRLFNALEKDEQQNLRNYFVKEQAYLYFNKTGPGMYPSLEAEDKALLRTRWASGNKYVEGLLDELQGEIKVDSYRQDVMKEPEFRRALEEYKENIEKAQEQQKGQDLFYRKLLGRGMLFLSFLGMALGVALNQFAAVAVFGGTVSAGAALLSGGVLLPLLFLAVIALQAPNADDLPWIIRVVADIPSYIKKLFVTKNGREFLINTSIMTVAAAISVVVPMVILMIYFGSLAAVPLALGAAGGAAIGFVGFLLLKTIGEPIASLFPKGNNKLISTVLLALFGAAVGLTLGLIIGPAVLPLLPLWIGPIVGVIVSFPGALYLYSLPTVTKMVIPIQNTDALLNIHTTTTDLKGALNNRFENMPLKEMVNHLKNLVGAVEQLQLDIQKPDLSQPNLAALEERLKAIQQESQQLQEKLLGSPDKILEGRINQINTATASLGVGQPEADWQRLKTELDEWANNKEIPNQTTITEKIKQVTTQVNNLAGKISTGIESLQKSLLTLKDPAKSQQSGNPTADVSASAQNSDVLKEDKNAVLTVRI